MNYYNKYRDFSYYSDLNEAPTLEMIKAVYEWNRLGIIPSKDVHDLVWSLKEGLISRPLWEDYGLAFNARGLPTRFVGF